MGFMDKLRNRFKMAEGHTKQEVGRASRDRSMEASGQADRAEGATRQVGEQAKDAAKNVRDAFKR